MKIVRQAVAGTLESSDLMVKVAPREEGLEIALQSEVIFQFGSQIEHVIRDTLSKLGVTDGLFIIEDKGALDCVVRSRVQTAVQRAADVWDVKWSALS